MRRATSVRHMRNPIAGLALAGLLLSSGAAVADDTTSRVAGGVVTPNEYARVERGMTRSNVERIFGAGKGCQYLRIRRGEAIGTGRQYPNTTGTGLTGITYVTRNGVTRMTGRQWNTEPAC